MTPCSRGMHHLHWDHEHHLRTARTPLPYHPSIYQLREVLETLALEASPVGVTSPVTKHDDRLLDGLPLGSPMEVVLSRAPGSS